MSPHSDPMLFRLVVLAAALVLAPPAAVAQVTVAASADPTTVGVGEVVAFTLDVEGELSGLGEVGPPPARGLALVGRAPVFRSQATRSGRGRLTLRWLYEAVAPGPARIGSARVPLGRRTLATDPIRVEVRPTAPPRPTPAPPAPDEPDVPAADLFVRAEPSARRVFVGQQAVVTYVLYFDPHLAPRRAQTLGSWGAAGFWREELDVGPDETFPRTRRVGGRTLAAVTLRRVALFPTRAGRLDVGAMTFGVDVLRPDGGGPFGSLFSPFSSRLEEERLTAPAFALDVQALPPGAPAGFDGAVGLFGLAVALDRDRVTVGEGVRLTVTLSGTGNTAALDAPAVAAPPGWEAFGPEVSPRDLDRRLVPLQGTATFAYTLVPRGGGRFEVPPVTFAYFDPEAGQYRTLTSAPLGVVVDGPPAQALAATPDPDAPRGPMAEADWQRARPSRRPSGWWLVLGAALPLAALGAATAVRRRAARPRAFRAGAEPALLDPLGGDPATFHRALERAVREAVAARYGVSPVLPRSALLDALATSAPAEERAEVDGLLRTCAAALYAPGPPPSPAERDALAARARHFLMQMGDRT